MVITFPVLISETVDKEVLPYLLKAIERKVLKGEYVETTDSNMVPIQERKNEFNRPYCPLRCCSKAFL